MRGEKCLVIGGGNVALRKIEILRKFEAKITCVSPDLIFGLERLKAGGKIRYIKRTYSGKIPLKRYKFVVAATDDLNTNKRIAARCRSQRVLVNVVNKGSGADVIMPAILKRKGFTIAVSTDGKNCSRAKRIRDRLKDAI